MSTASPRLHGWLHPAVLSAAALSVAAGYAQFGVTAALPDVAAAFGEPTAPAAATDASLVAQIGLSTTALGIGLGVIRLASLGTLPLGNAADHHGRRRLILACSLIGLTLTAGAALSPTYAVFVVIAALARPLLSTTNLLSGVIAAEETTSRDRAKAIALITAAYGFGAGTTAVLRAVGGADFGFRELFGLTLVPLLLVVLVARAVPEPDRFRRVAGGAATALGRVPRPYRRRLALLVGVTFGLTFVTGPVNTYLFVYAESVVGLSRTATAAIGLATGVIGLPGLLLGRWAADRVGRRFTAVVTQALLATGGMITYSGVDPAIGVAGYFVTIFAGACYAPAAGALSAEIFPTAVRATAGGWITVAGVFGAVAGLVAFGALADAFGSFAPAAVIVCAPVVLASGIYALLPETRGLELEQSAPDLPGR